MPTPAVHYVIGVDASYTTNPTEFLTVQSARVSYISGAGSVMCSVMVSVNMLFSVMTLISAIVAIFTVAWTCTVAVTNIREIRIHQTRWTFNGDKVRNI